MLTLATPLEHDECIRGSLERKHYTAARRINRVFHISPGLLRRGDILHRILSNAIRMPLISVPIRSEPIRGLMLKIIVSGNEIL